MALQPGSGLAAISEQLAQSLQRRQQALEGQWGSRPGYMFGPGTGFDSHEELARQREQQDMLQRAHATSPFPTDFASGMTYLGRGIAARMGERGLAEREGEARGQVRGALSGAVGQMAEGSGGGGLGDVVSALGSGGQGGMSPQQAAESQGMVIDDASRVPQGGKSLSGNQQEFIDAMMPHALRVSEATGLDPRLVIAQAAQETGWGRSAPNNNFFGIKSHGREGGATLGTHEYVNGQRVNMPDSFRTYGDMGESADDYANFLMTNPRYREMLAAGDLDSQLAALGQSGYATDPNYARSVGSIARSINLPDTRTASLNPDVMTDAAPQQTPVNVADAATQLGALDTSQPTLLGITGQGDENTAMIRMADGSVTRAPAQNTGEGYMIEGMGMAEDIGQPIMSTGGGMQPDPLGFNLGTPVDAPQAAPQPAPQQPPEAAPQPQEPPQVAQPPQQDYSAIVGPLMDVLGSPFASPQEQQIAEMLLGNVMEQMMAPPPDPVAMELQQIELEKQRLALEAKRNPQADPMTLNPGQTVYTPGTGEAEFTAPRDQGFRMATPEEAQQYGAVAGQFGPDGRFYPINPPSGMSIESDGQGGFRIVQGPGAVTELGEAPDVSPAAPTSGAEEQFSNAGDAFGAGSVARGLANRISDTLTGRVPFPETLEAQRDFAVFGEGLINAFASAYNRQPPSWLLRNVEELTPKAGSLFEGPQQAQSKLRSISRDLRQRRDGFVAQLEGSRRVQNREDLLGQIAGIDATLAQLNAAMEGFSESPTDQQEMPDWLLNTDPRTWTPEQMDEAERIWGLGD